MIRNKIYKYYKTPWNLIKISFDFSFCFSFHFNFVMGEKLNEFQYEVVGCVKNEYGTGKKNWSILGKKAYYFSWFFVVLV